MKWLSLVAVLFVVPCFAQELVPPAPPVDILKDAKVHSLDLKTGRVQMRMPDGSWAEVPDGKINGVVPKPPPPITRVDYPRAEEAPPSPVDPPARLVIGVPKQADPYTMVEIAIAPLGGSKDVMVMSVIGGEVHFIDVIATMQGTYVFTGPPGRYSIRVTTIKESGGFEYATANTVIGTPTTPPPPNPTEPTVPEEPPAPTNGKPPGEGTYGFAPLMYEEARQIRSAVGVQAISKLAENFEWAATSKIDSVGDLLAELKKRNELVYAANPTKWQILRDVWTSQADRLVEFNTLPGDSVEDYQIAFKETAFGLRAAIK